MSQSFKVGDVVEVVNARGSIFNGMHVKVIALPELPSGYVQVEVAESRGDFAEGTRMGFKAHRLDRKVTDAEKRRSDTIYRALLTCPTMAETPAPEARALAEELAHRGI